MAFGEILRNARIQKGLSLSDVAAGTNMLVQIVQALEKEELKRIAAPIYGRGFVKLYAEFLNLDHEPLIRDFMEVYDGNRVPSLKPEIQQARVEPAPVPVTRTVSEPVALDKTAEKQAEFTATAQPEPDVPAPRPAEADAVTEGEKPKIREVTPKAEDDIVPATVTMIEDRPALVVTPEEVEAEDYSEPDLFSIKQHQHRPVVEQIVVSDKKADKPRLTRGNQQLPVFKIGGHMDTAYIRKDKKERVSAFLSAIFKKIIFACGCIRDMLARAFSSVRLPQGKVLVLGGAGVLAVIIMISGLRILFKMTGDSSVDAPAADIEHISPPPDLYVD